ncbi:MAG: hypothetical protein ACI9SG_001569, partial [Maribacter sp.]
MDNQPGASFNKGLRVLYEQAFGNTEFHHP